MRHPEQHYSFRDFELDVELRELRRDGEVVALRRRPLDLLVYLVRHRQRVVPKTELLDALWPGVVVSEAALSSAMRDLRKALRDTGREQTVVRTYHGYGYRFVAPVGSDAPSRGVGPTADAPHDWTASVAARVAEILRDELLRAGLELTPLPQNEGRANGRSVATPAAGVAVSAASAGRAGRD